VTELRLDPTTGERTTFATARQDRTFLPPAGLCPLCPTTDPARPTEVPRDAYDIAVFENRWPALSGRPPEHLDAAERRDLADVLSAVLRAYDRPHGFSLQDVLSVHQRPTDGGDWDAVSHLHLELTPLHRTATELKCLAGSETGAGAFVADVRPEDAAARLRELMG
jgi:galactose-1-phosphate uridylyltransferase